MGEASIELPLDNDGFLRRECPSCEREFKWHNGPANEEAEQQPPTETYFCPLCGQPAGPDSWWTQAQLVLVEAAQQRLLDDSLRDAFKGFKSTKHVKVTMTGFDSDAGTPGALVEPDDMSIVASPCHGWEPVKVPSDDRGPFHCIVCGSQFAV